MCIPLIYVILIGLQRAIIISAIHVIIMMSYELLLLCVFLIYDISIGYTGYIIMSVKHVIIVTPYKLFLLCVFITYVVALGYTGYYHHIGYTAYDCDTTYIIVTLCIPHIGYSYRLYGLSLLCYMSYPQFALYSVYSSYRLFL